jgi:hypothetical protein
MVSFISLSPEKAYRLGACGTRGSVQAIEDMALTGGPVRLSCADHLNPGCEEIGDGLADYDACVRHPTHHLKFL